MNTLQQFFSDCLLLPWKSNSQDNPLHEQQVEALLQKHNLTYVAQPNGTHQSPDFRVTYQGKQVDIECKSSKQAHPTYNSGLPKEGVVYVFSSKKYNQTTIFFPEDIITPEQRNLYNQLVAELREVVSKYQALSNWGGDRGWDFYMRSMFTQSGGATLTNYFTHSNRELCEQRVLNHIW